MVLPAPSPYRQVSTQLSDNRCSCNVKDTYQSYDIEHSRQQVWQPSSAKVVHCEVRHGLEKNQVQENEYVKRFAWSKQLLQTNKMKTIKLYDKQHNYIH